MLPNPLPLPLPATSLLGLRPALGDAAGALEAWSADTNPCGLTPWPYVECGTPTAPSNGSASSVVMGLSLQNLGLRGGLPDALALPTGLRALRLSANSLGGTLPVSWSGLRDLRELTLDANALTGSLPDTWSALPALQLFNASSNRLASTLPPGWGAGLGNITSMWVGAAGAQGPMHDCFCCPGHAVMRCGHHATRCIQYAACNLP